MLFDELNMAREAMLEAARALRHVLERENSLERLIMSTGQELKDSFAAVAQQEAANSAKIDTLIGLANQLVAGLQFPMSQADVDAMKAAADDLLGKMQGDGSRIDAAVAADTPPAPPAPAPAPVEAPAAAPAPAADGTQAGDTSAA